jgi:hypothetical protein
MFDPALKHCPSEHPGDPLQALHLPEGRDRLVGERYETTGE